MILLCLSCHVAEQVGGLIRTWNSRFPSALDSTDVSLSVSF
jgi:hypothetical protein